MFWRHKRFKISFSQCGLKNKADIFFTMHGGMESQDTTRHGSQEKEEKDEKNIGYNFISYSIFSFIFCH